MSEIQELNTIVLGEHESSSKTPSQMNLPLRLERPELTKDAKMWLKCLTRENEIYFEGGEQIPKLLELHKSNSIIRWHRTYISCIKPVLGPLAPYHTKVKEQMEIREEIYQKQIDSIM